MHFISHGVALFLFLMCFFGFFLTSPLLDPSHNPPPGVQYVIILTKADKKDGKVSPSLKQQVADALDAHQLKETTPVLVTSAVNRLGRDEVWRYLRLAVIKPEENR